MTIVPKIKMSPEGPALSTLVQGYWHFAEWNMNPQQRLSFIKEHVELGITTVDHAHVYGNPSCERLFGEALKTDPLFAMRLRSFQNAVSTHQIQEKSLIITQVSNRYCPLLKNL